MLMMMIMTIKSDDDDDDDDDDDGDDGDFTYSCLSCRIAPGFFEAHRVVAKHRGVTIRQ